jgi:hypothetical protein
VPIGKVWVSPTSESLHLSINAPIVTLGSWKLKFKGKAADVLLNTISTYLCQKNVRVQHCSIVNSSGTGKSRMVDELATRIITVPMCLRKSGSQGITVRCFSVSTSSSNPIGFPPPDEELRNWLLSLQENNQGTVSEKLYRFIYALLDVTLRRLKKIQDDRPGNVLHHCYRGYSLTVSQISNAWLT